MHIQSNISLKPYNTFGIDVTAAYFVTVATVEELYKVLELQYTYPKMLFLGGGSNILFTEHLDALVVHLQIKGITIISTNKKEAIVRVNAGENWHEFVSWCLSQNLGGAENLSLIPGCVGAAPIQNIGAYGVELKDIFMSCEAVHKNTLAIKTFNKEACQFGYRESVFKQQYKSQYVITSVTLKLTTSNHIINTKYGAIAEQLEKMKISRPTIQDVSQAVIRLREAKLPNPNKIGNSGSFFKNPIVLKSQYETLKSLFPEIPYYEISATKGKIPAAWLIEIAGFKGKRFNNCGIHKNQALVIVNYGGALGKEILKLARLIQETVYGIFNIKLDTEVNILE